MSNFGFDNLQASVQQVVGALQAELDELIQRKAHIKRRRRTLARALKRSANVQAVDKASRRVKSRGYRTRIKRSTAAASRTRSLHDHLLRACRIAFMEAGGIAAPDQILAAILRRGSFQFHALAESPQTAIFRMLTAMAEMNEAKCLDGELSGQWEYMPRERPGTK